MRRLLFKLSSTALVFFTFGCGSTPGASDTASVGQFIAGGSPDAEHRNVFLTISHISDYGALCSGTLIAPNMILTARHCVSDGGSEQVICGESAFTSTIAGSSVFATNDETADQSSTFFNGYDVRVPPEGNDTCGFDVALIVLVDAVPDRVTLPAIPRIDREVQAGESYTAVGYGQDEAGSAGGARRKRADLTVQCAPGDCQIYGVESTEFLGDTGICSGDSGGPALDSDGKVVGVVSRGGDGCSSPIYGTVTAWKDWLMTNALDAADIGNYEPPFWATSGSSDAPVDETPPVEIAKLGEACQSQDQCGSGLACYYVHEQTDATCHLLCKSNSDCSGAEQCRSIGATSVCAQPAGSADESSGCSFAEPAKRPEWLLAGLALVSALGLHRRRATRKARS